MVPTPFFRRKLLRRVFHHKILENASKKWGIVQLRGWAEESTDARDGRIWPTPIPRIVTKKCANSASGKNWLHHLASNIRQAEISTLELVHQFLVIHAH